MDRNLPRFARAAVVVVLVLLPASYIAFKYDAETQFSSLILFGERFDARALDEVREIPRMYAGPVGYDGQFYAQLAVDPTLRHPQLDDALDNPRYRSRRILAPAVAHVLGLGRPGMVLRAYALVNMLFFLLLLGGMLRFLRPRTGRDLLCLAAVLWTTGCLISVRRSLVDLPASTLLFYSACIQGAGAVPMLAAAILARETSVLSVIALPWPARLDTREVIRRVAAMGIAVVPFALWFAYVLSRFPPGMSAARLGLGFPLAALVRHVTAALHAFAADPGISLAFEVLAPVSLLAQAAYLACRPRLSSPYWRMGIGFAVLLPFLSGAVFHEQIAYTRTVLPMTIAFNILLMRFERKRFAAWFVAGNAGLAWCALHMLGEMLGAF